MIVTKYQVYKLQKRDFNWLVCLAAISFFSLHDRRLHEWLAGQASFFEKSPSLTAYEEMTESNIKEIQQQVCKTKKRVKALMRTMENQNRLLVLMAKKMDLNVEADDLDAKNALSETELLEPRSLGNNESDDDKKDRKTEVAGL